MLTFATPTAGKITWDFRPISSVDSYVPPRTQNFEAYSETLDPASHILSVSFRIEILHPTCSMQFDGKYGTD